MKRGWRAPDALVLAALALAAGAAAAVAASGPAGAGDPGARELRRALLGGTGLGRALDLSRCPGAHDPRTGGDCTLRHGPVPGSDPLCTDHALPPLGGAR